ncbi:hypothetical protein [Legionella fallonii]|uniref:Uncharacterized protein n=1 Tax=Legionella fallonii LLAP-10 TaxID=1212491 RepID=A0A098G5H4_9GAMM|nr:hypothetical protein [Legionella fallonii]CEG57707.1 protein of unknown function [Legionella fallonii LLAP-10]
MPQFTSDQDPVIALTLLRQSFAKKIMDAGNSSDLETKIRLADEVVKEYDESIPNLSIMDKYQESKEEPAIVLLRKELRSQLDVATRMADRYSEQFKIAQEKAAEKQAKKDRYIKLSMNSLDAQIQLIREIEYKDIPNLPELQQIADELHQTLTKIRDEYETHIKTGKRNGQTISLQEAWKLIDKQWEFAIATYHAARANLVQRLQQPLKTAAEEAVGVVRAQRARTVIGKIDKVLEELTNKIDGIGHSHPEAKNVAKNLHATLLEARDNYFVQLVNGEENGETIDADEAGTLFKARCKLAISVAMPTLEKDLSWGDYLKNMLKAIVNAAIYVVTLGHVNGFFAYSKSEASEVVATADEELQHADQISFSPQI